MRLERSRWVIFSSRCDHFCFCHRGSHQVERMSQDESQAGSLTGVGKPIPPEHAFAADGQVVPVGFNQLEKEVEVVVFDVGMDQFFTLAIHDADVHLPGMEVDSAVEFCGGCIILHIDCDKGVVRHRLNIISYAGSGGHTPRPLLLQCYQKTKRA